MPPILGIIHFTRAAIDPINALFGPRLAEDGVEILNFLDEAVLRHTLRDGPLSDVVLQRLEHMLTSAERAGACLIVSSGSSLSPAVDRIAGRIATPVLKIEAPLAAEAVNRFRDVAVVVTKRSNVEPFSGLLNAVGRAHGRQLHVRFHVRESAFAALVDNDPELHDTIVLDAIADAARDPVEAILLPQVSIARIMRRVTADLEIPVLSSIDVGLEEVRRVLRARTGEDESSRLTPPEYPTRLDH